VSKKGDESCMTTKYEDIERKDKSNCVSAWRVLEVEGTKTKGGGRKTWIEFVKVG